MKYLKILILLVVIGIAGYFIKKYWIAPDIELNNITLIDKNGKRVEWDNVKDKVIFLNFFATWCAPCREEMVAIEKMYDYLPKDKFAIFVISDEDTTLLSKFREKANFHFDIYSMVQSRKSLGINTIPMSYFVNHKGEILWKHVGTYPFNDKKSLKEFENLYGK